MEDGLLSLKWNNHKSTFFHILSEVRGKHTYTDATLACEGKFYPVHKLVMSTCSDYFAEIFEKTPCKNPVVVLKDIKKSDLDALLDYMYIGEVDVRQSELAGLIKAAECLRIKGLAVPDEDPTKAQKKGPNNVPERREDSPPAKRKRRESGERGRNLHSPIPRGSSHSSSSSHLPSTSSSVPSHAPSQQSSVPESLVPSQPMPPPSGVHQESRHSDSLRGRQESQSQLQQSAPQVSSLRPSPDPSSHRSAETSQSSSSQRTSEASMLPVQMIKVEVDEGTDSASKDIHSERGDEGGSDLGGDDEETSNDYTEYQSHSGEIEKEEHDQMDYGADQLPGPSGLQGGPPMLGWGDEGEGGFPHNLFGSDDPASQQAGRDDDIAALDECRLPLPPAFLSRLGLPPHPAPLPPHAAASHHHHPAPAAAPGLPVEAVDMTDLDLELRKHICSVCGRRFRLANDLRRHLRIHTGEKPFLCPHCPYRASQKQSVNRHVRTVHADLLFFEEAAMNVQAHLLPITIPSREENSSSQGRVDKI